MGGKIDETKPFLAINIAVMTVSDTRTLETDTSGALLAEHRYYSVGGGFVVG